MKKLYTNIRLFFCELVYKFHAYFFENHYKKITRLLVPNLLQLNKIKMGREGDGCYVLPDNFIQNNTSLLSFGVADDISFEKAFLEKYPSSKVFTFDPSIDILPEQNKDIYFEGIGVAGRDNFNKKLFTIDSILNKYNISFSNQTIIKMDIEGWEWGVFEKFDFKNKNIPLITIEFHFMSINSTKELIFFPFYFYKRYKTIQKVLDHFYIFHLHANNYRYVFF